MNYRQPFVDQRWEDLENEIYQLENGLEKEIQVANHNIEDLKKEVTELRKLVAENLNKSLDTIEWIEYAIYRENEEREKWIIQLQQRMLVLKS